MGAPNWRDRQHELLRLLAQVVAALEAPAPSPDEQLHRALLQPREAASTATATSKSPAARLRTVALSLDDFVPLSTLSSTSLLSRVEVVRPASTLTGQGSSQNRCYVMKTVDKRWAFRMRAQQSHIHELAVLRLGAESEKQANACRRIPRLVASFLSPTAFHIVLSHAPGGDLSTVLEHHVATESTAGGLPEAWVKGWMAELVDALEWLHSNGWAHRDVKPQNLVLDADGHLLLTDFGSAAPLLLPQTCIARKHCRALIGTPDYIAPEILSHAEALYLEVEDADSDDEEGGGGGGDGLGISTKGTGRSPVPDSNDNLPAYSAAVDLWSSGIVMYELLYGVAPFYADKIPETYDRIVRWRENLRFPTGSTVSKAAESTIKALLTDAASRPTFEKVKSLEFFAGVQWDQLRTVKPAYQPPQLSSGSSFPGSPSLSRSQRSFAQPFDVESFISSPGLSILRPSPSTLVRVRDVEQLYWEAHDFGGLTTLPSADEFDQLRPSSSSQGGDHLGRRPVSPPRSRIEKERASSSSSSFETPARPRWSAQIEREVLANSSSSSSSRSKRSADGLEAWREMQEHAWSVSRSAQRRAAVATATAVPSSSSPAVPASSLNETTKEEAQDSLGGLESRHGQMMKQLDDMDHKYSSLFALAANQGPPVV
ncbi:hypothetical protein JCM3774_003273 [Rhodotorula dairenensis]